MVDVVIIQTNRVTEETLRRADGRVPARSFYSLMSLYIILFILEFGKLLLALSSGLLSQPLILRSRCNQPFCDGKRQPPILYDVTIMAVSCFSYEFMFKLMVSSICAWEIFIHRWW